MPTEILIAGCLVPDSTMEALFAAKETIDGEIKSRASDEVQSLESRLLKLRTFLGDTPPFLETPIAQSNESGRTLSVPKYRNPLQPEQTWTGRGKKPHWAQAHIAVGGDLETLRIPEPA